MTIAGVAETKGAWLQLPTLVPLDVWRRVGEQLANISNLSSWWLGDWLVYGESTYPDRYRNAIEDTALDYQTLKNYAWVARKFPPSRRRDQLSLQHHQEVAALPCDDQDLWLDRAEQLTWSKAELRRQLKAARKALAEVSSETVKIQMNVEPAIWNRWQKAAAASESQVLEWVVDVVDEAATHLLAP